jgi:flagellar biosynthetic protein FlhB
MPGAALPAWVASAGTAVLLLPAWTAATMSAATEMLRGTIATAGRPTGALTDSLAPSVVAVSIPTMAVVVAAAAAGIAVRILLDGWSWQPGRALPSLRRIDPFAGLARIVSWRTMRTACGSVATLAVLILVATAAIAPLVAATASLREWSPVARSAWRATAVLMATGAAIAVIRWALARREFEARIRMTPEEFAEEAKGMQADPRIRLLGRQRSSSRSGRGGA